MQRIITDKRDTVAKIVEKILESLEAEIVLVVPSNSVLSARGESDFQLLKREAEAADKRISLESVDKEVLALAKKARIEAIHPLFKNEEISRSLSDIIPFRKASSEQPFSTPATLSPPTGGASSLAGRAGGKASEGSLRFESSRSSLRSRNDYFGGVGQAARYATEEKKKKGYKIQNATPEDKEDEKVESRSKVKKDEEVMEIEEELKAPFYRGMQTRKILLRRFKVAGIIVVVLVFAGGVAWAAGAIFGKAEITISFKKVPWQYQDTFLGDKIVAKIDADKRSFPLEVFQQNKNVTRLFPASGKTQTNQKATGRITIYNAYGASSQLLVASTRFMAPDGKIFHLDSQVLIPGAKVQSGKIIPSSVEANVTADKAGEEYNVGPIAHLTIPGFKDSPKYVGFYGAFLGQVSGGSTGQKLAPTDQDILSAKDKTTESLKANLENASLNNRPEGFKILPGASQIQIAKLTVNKTVDQNGNFGVFGEASFQAVGFRESDVRAILEALAGKDYPQMIFQDLKLDYTSVKPNFKTGQLSFSLSAQAVLEPQLSTDDLKSKISGRNVNDAKQTILTLPDLSSAKISLWPFWLYHLPTDPKKINIVVD